MQLQFKLYMHYICHYHNCMIDIVSHALIVLIINKMHLRFSCIYGNYGMKTVAAKTSKCRLVHSIYFFFCYFDSTFKYKKTQCVLSD